MRAIQIKEPNKMEMIEVETPKLRSDEDVLVRIRAFGICGSDAAILKGSNPFVSYPRIIGHEVAGEVVEVGSGVDKLKPGDKVSLEPIEFCNECYACRNNRHNVCRELEVYGVHRDGGFCEYLVTDKSKWHKVDDSLSFAHAAVAEPYTIAEQSTSRARVKEGDLVLVTGAGPMGLLITDVAKDKKARVIISEINEKRRKIAKEFGADYIINPLEESLEEKINEISKGEGVNVFLDSTGVYSVIAEGMKHLSPASRFVPLAFGPEDIPINFENLNKREVDVLGTRLQYEKFPLVCQKLHKKKEILDKFVTHIFKAEEFEEAFNVFMKEGTDAIKVILTF